MPAELRSWMRWICRNLQGEGRPNGLDTYEVSVLVVLLRHADEHDLPGFAELEPRELVDQVPMSRGQLYKKLPRLEELGIVVPGELSIAGETRRGYLLRQVSLSETPSRRTVSVRDSDPPKVSDRDSSGSKNGAPVSVRDTQTVSDRDRCIKKIARGRARGEKESSSTSKVKKKSGARVRDRRLPDAGERERLPQPAFEIGTLHELTKQATRRAYALSPVWVERYEHVVLHWTADEIDEALHAASRAREPSWNYVVGVLNRIASEGPAYVPPAKPKPVPADSDDVAGEYSEMSDEELVELAGDDLRRAWREYFIRNGYTPFPPELEIWTELLASELRDGGIRMPPEVRP